MIVVPMALICRWSTQNWQRCATGPDHHRKEGRAANTFLMKSRFGFVSLLRKAKAKAYSFSG